MRRGSERGFTLVALLIMAAALAMGASLAGPTWSDQSRMDKEKELLKIGLLYASALEQYRSHAPGSAKGYPADLNELLLDHRFVGTTRYLRKLYDDPVSPQQPWGLMRNADNQIIGVFSRSTESPFRQGPLTLSHPVVGSMELPPAKHYSDWKFSFATR